MFQSRNRVRRLMATTTAGIALALGMGSVAAQQPATAPSTTSGQSPAPGPGQGPGRGRGGFTQPEPLDFQEHEGWTSLFDGKTLDGWSGDKNWKAEDGAITIESTCDNRPGRSISCGREEKRPISS